MPTDLERRFNLAVRNLRRAPRSGPVKVGNTQKLFFYGRYKRVMFGICHDSQPAIWHPMDRAKWGAWNATKTLSKRQAMQEYVEEFLRLANSIDTTILSDKQRRQTNEFLQEMQPRTPKPKPKRTTTSPTPTRTPVQARTPQQNQRKTPAAPAATTPPTTTNGDVHNDTPPQTSQSHVYTNGQAEDDANASSSSGNNTPQLNGFLTTTERETYTNANPPHARTTKSPVREVKRRGADPYPSAATIGVEAPPDDNKVNTNDSAAAAAAAAAAPTTTTPLIMNTTPTRTTKVSLKNIQHIQQTNHQKLSVLEKQLHSLLQAVTSDEKHNLAYELKSFQDEVRSTLGNLQERLAQTERTVEGLAPPSLLEWPPRNRLVQLGAAVVGGILLYKLFR